MFLRLFIALVLAAAPLRAEVDPYWEIISGGTQAQSQTVQGSGGNAALANTQAAYDMARGWNAQTGRPLTFQDIQALNATMRAGTGNPTLGGAPGQLRNWQVVAPTSGGAERNVFPSSRAMPAEAAKLDAYLREVTSRPLTRSQAITAAADVHSFIVQNHMFGDANGRTARMAADTILMRNGLPPADYKALTPLEYNTPLSGTAAENKLPFRQSMEKAVAAAEQRVGTSPRVISVARPGQPTELLGVKSGGAPQPLPELTPRNLRARSFSPLVGGLTAAGLHVGGRMVGDAFHGEFKPGEALKSLASWEFLGGMGGFILGERIMANAIGSMIPIPGVGKLVAKPLVAAALRGSAGAAGATLAGQAAKGEKIDWTDLAGSSVASGVGMAIGQTLIPIPVVGAVVGGVVGGLIWDVGYGFIKKKEDPRPGLPPMRTGPAGLAVPRGGG